MTRIASVLKLVALIIVCCGVPLHANAHDGNTTTSNAQSATVVPGLDASAMFSGATMRWMADGYVAVGPSRMRGPNWLAFLGGVRVNINTQDPWGHAEGSATNGLIEFRVGGFWQITGGKRGGLLIQQQLGIAGQWDAGNNAFDPQVYYSMRGSAFHGRVQWQLWQSLTIPPMPTGRVVQWRGYGHVTGGPWMSGPRIGVVAWNNVGLDESWDKFRIGARLDVWEGIGVNVAFLGNEARIVDNVSIMLTFHHAWDINPRRRR